MALVLLAATLLVPGRGVEVPYSVNPEEDANPRRTGAVPAAVPVTFEANRGQTNRQVRFLARGSDSTLFLTDREAVLSVGPSSPPNPTGPGGPSERPRVVTMKLAHAARVRPSGVDRLAATTNYLVGDDPQAWRTSIPAYAGVAYRDVYPGIDVVYHATSGELEYDFLVAPGTDPDRIVLSFGPSSRPEVNDAGNLVLHTSGGDVLHKKPHIYQTSGGKKNVVQGSFRVLGQGKVGFAVGTYDPRARLIIDPVMAYSTFLGTKSDTGDQSRGIAVTPDGQALVTGTARAANFPVTNGTIQEDTGGGADVFVAKINPGASGARSLAWSAIIGGSGDDGGAGIALDPSGNVFVTGFTWSGNFTASPGAFQTEKGADSDAFMTVLNPTGSSLIYSTYLGGSGREEGSGLAVDTGGNTVVVGSTSSSNFPLKAAIQNDYQETGQGDAFISKINPAEAGGESLIYSTYLGGTGFGADAAASVALDPAGNAYISGTTDSPDFPTKNAFQPALANGSDAFVAKLTPPGSLVYSTYLGGGSQGAPTLNPGRDSGRAIAVDTAGNAYIAGQTTSTDFPLKNSWDGEGGGTSEDAFLAKLDPQGTSLLYSTYLGGTDSSPSALVSSASGTDGAAAVTLDDSGLVYIGGSTESVNFPTTPDAFQPGSSGGLPDAFLAAVDTSRAGSASLVYSTYLGGSTGTSSPGSTSSAGGDFVLGLAAGAGNIYLTGRTNSTDFPTTESARQPVAADAAEAFITIFSGMPAVGRLDPPEGAAVGGTQVTITGQGFIGTKRVTFGGEDAGYRVVSPRTIVAEAPPHTPGNVDVVVTAAGGTSSSSPGSRFRYDGDAPGPPLVEDLDAEAASSKEIVLSFTVPGLAGLHSPPASSYVIKQSRQPISDSQSFEDARSLCGGLCTFAAPSAGDYVALSVTGLTPGTTYHYALRVQDSAGALGPISNGAHATTPGGTRARAGSSSSMPSIRRRTTTSISFAKGTFKGRIESPKPACERRLVGLFRRGPGRDPIVRRTRSNRVGQWRITARSRPGRFFVRVARKAYVERNTKVICGAGRSRILTRSLGG